MTATYRIDVNFVIKVADFGLSVCMDLTKDYFRQLQEQKEVIKLPVKWLAPESITDGVYSEKSDVVIIIIRASEKSEGGGWRAEGRGCLTW